MDKCMKVGTFLCLGDYMLVEIPLNTLLQLLTITVDSREVIARTPSEVFPIKLRASSQ
jgi:hypothetical protein